MVSTKYVSLKDIQDDISRGQLTCVDVVKGYLENISKKKHLNVFLEVFEEEALAKAKAIDEKFVLGTQGKLAGLVVGIKDLLCYQGHTIQASSKILEGFQSQFSGTAVERLINEDAIIIGRQNCDEFGMGSSNENSSFGPTLNEIDNSRVPGGSSGASAVSVQADLCMVALGSDTGGSVRQPAAFCGVIGLKPTYSRISRHGLIAYASSFDTIGIFSKTIADNARVLEVIAGKDEFDATVSQSQVDRYTEKLDFNKKVKVAYLKETLESEGLAEDIKSNTLAAIDFLKSDGHDVNPVEFPMIKYALPTYYILTTAEASSNLSRYDGVKYGYRSENAEDLLSMYKNSRTEAFGDEVIRRILLGTFVLSANYYDAYYTKAQKVRQLIKEQTESLLENYDFIILPTTPSTAFKIGEKNDDPLNMYLADLFTVQASVAGIPAISIPNGVDKDGLPIGLQIMTKNFNESDLFSFSKYMLENL